MTLYKAIDDIIADKKKYFIIYADPPWEYNNKRTGGSFCSGSAQQYNVMNIDDLRRMPINKISSDKSILFIWVTFPMLQEGLDTIQAWGFKYKTLGFNWIKITQNNKIFVGMGNYTQQNPEICLIGTKGIGISDMRISKNISAVILDRISQHSRKPDIVRKKIIQLFGHKKPKIELFARTKHEGWDLFGDQLH